jgi:hypothetical protein
VLAADPYAKSQGYHTKTKGTGIHIISYLYNECKMLDLDDDDSLAVMADGFPVTWFEDTDHVRKQISHRITGYPGSERSFNPYNLVAEYSWVNTNRGFCIQVM